MSLLDFRKHYKASRQVTDTTHSRWHKRFPRLSAATIREHDMTLRYLIEHFGEGKGIDAITELDVDRWLTALAAGKLSRARKTNQSFTLTDETIRGRIRDAKAMFNWALAFGYVSTNPFANYNGTSLPGKPNHYVTVKEFERVIGQADEDGNLTIGDGWRVLFGICRLAGLRLSAARTLPWSGTQIDTAGVEHWVGIDWDRRRLCLVGNHKTKRVYREVPICPRLYDILQDAHEGVDDAAASITGVGAHNLTRIGQKVVMDAKVKVWPKLFQAMRSSCENDWKQAGVAEATYCAWLGHSPDVSRKHYVAPTDDEYKAVTFAAA